MRTRHRVPIDTQPLLSVQEEEEQEAAEEAAADGAMWEEHLQAMWCEMSKQELEEEVKWRRDDQKALAERTSYLQAELNKKDDELTKKDNELKQKYEEILRQYQVIDRQRSYIDSLHQLTQRRRGPMQQLMQPLDQ